MKRPGFVTFTIFLLLVGGAFGTFISFNVLVFDPILYTQVQTEQQAFFGNLIFAISTLDSVLSVIAGIGMILARNWARILAAVLFLSTPLNFLLEYVLEPAATEDVLIRFLAIAIVVSALFVSLGLALLISERSRLYFGVLAKTRMIETPPPPPEFD